MSKLGARFITDTAIRRSVLATTERNLRTSEQVLIYHGKPTEESVRPYFISDLKEKALMLDRADCLMLVSIEKVKRYLMPRLFTQDEQGTVPSTLHTSDRAKRRKCLRKVSMKSLMVTTILRCMKTL